ncbi:hypothetical protein BJ992_001822 [Sphaerisporangium rubeum]|uniref:Uncharacterized protein n=1 Tax=Sphaerisporangium rubeum TaxID=321317 RepID=A0A7X0IBX4_9ACTN|nr:hypothetical protein [Sphaerisporangium rubeum]
MASNGDTSAGVSGGGTEEASDEDVGVADIG